MGQHGWRAMREPGKKDQPVAHPPFFGSSELLGQLRQMWEGSEFALKQTPVSSASESWRWAGEGSPSLPFPGAAADTLGQERLKIAPATTARCCLSMA